MTHVCIVGDNFAHLYIQMSFPHVSHMFSTFPHFIHKVFHIFGAVIHIFEALFHMFSTFFPHFLLSYPHFSGVFHILPTFTYVHIFIKSQTFVYTNDNFHIVITFVYTNEYFHKPKIPPKYPYFLASRFFGFFQKKSRFFQVRFKFFGIFQINKAFIFLRFKFFEIFRNVPDFFQMRFYRQGFFSV